MDNFKLDSHRITDMVSEGLILIDQAGVIQLYNQKAKEIFGVVYQHQFDHSRGTINPGDFIIIADNSVGIDDGKLDEQKLSCLGNFEEKFQEKDAIIAFGQFGTEGKGSLTKRTPPYKQDIFKEQREFKNLKISASIDFKKQRIEIAVDQMIFVLPYEKAIGHMVVLDGENGALKFYQERGYSARNESIGQLLISRTFRGKGVKEDHLKVLGEHILTIHDHSAVIKDFLNCSKGEQSGYENRFAEINGRQTKCTLIPVRAQKKVVAAALKVEDITEIRSVVKERDDALRHLEIIEKELKNDSLAEQTFLKIIGDSTVIRQLRILVAKASKSSSNVLLLGESGTGKTMIARSIHDGGDFFDKPFIHVNCGSIPENLLESELFGYEKGAFSGASTKGKKGYFEMANGGTLFLDEIGEIPLNLQVKLLHAIQHKEFYPIGSDRTVEVDVRIIAATNRNLEKEMKEGNFREDLYYRINVIPIWLPPLRDRKEDISSLVRSILPRVCREKKMNEKHLTAEALTKMMDYEWPGNIRELENILERALLLSEGSIIHSEHIMINNGTFNFEQEQKTLRTETLKGSTKAFEKSLIIKVLDEVEGDRKKAMAILEVGKTQFYKKLKDYDIES